MLNCTSCTKSTWTILRCLITHKHSLNSFHNFVGKISLMWLMLVDTVTKIQQIKPTKVQYFSSVFPKNDRKNCVMPWFIFRSATSRVAPVHNDRLLSLLIMTCVCHCTGSCFVIERSRLQNQITLRLVFYSWQLLASLFIVHEYWRNSTSYV